MVRFRTDAGLTKAHNAASLGKKPIIQRGAANVRDGVHSRSKCPCRYRNDDGTDPSRLRVLIVDDHGPSASSRQAARAWGFEVCVCQDGRQAVQCAELFRPDVLLLDIMLPGIDGLQLARRFRDADQFRHVTLIA